MAKASFRITYLGHATVLIELDGLRILTDPLLRPRVFHLRRVAPPPTAEQLSSIDLILISHAHHDHLDVHSLRLIEGKRRLFCPSPARGPVASAGLDPEVVGVGESIQLGAVSVAAVHAEHDGRRMPYRSDTDAVGYVLRGPSGSIYFAGDTGFFDAIGGVAPVDVALLPVAGWGPRLGSGHLNPDEAARAAALINPRVAIPIHWGSYERIAMKRDGERDDPARRFVDQVGELSIGTRAEVLAPGASLSLEPAAGSA